MERALAMLHSADLLSHALQHGGKFVERKRTRARPRICQLDVKYCRALAIAEPKSLSISDLYSFGLASRLSSLHQYPAESGAREFRTISRKRRALCASLVRGVLIGDEL